MGQILHTKNFGDLDIEHGGWQEGQAHIVQLTNGAYCHVSGLPVNSKKEFAQAGMKGRDLTEAEHWFDHRHDEEEAPPKAIKFGLDGYPLFEDGTPVEKYEDLYQSLPPGEVLNAAITALTKKLEAQKKAAKLEQAKAEAAAKPMAGKQTSKKGPVARGPRQPKPAQATM